MIPISIPHLYKEDKDLAIEAIETGFIAQGKNIKLFEEKFAEYCGRKYGVSCSNGTVALYLAIKSLNLPKGSEVILPSLTILSCLTAVLENGLKPVFCDSHLHNFNAFFPSIIDKITNKTSAIMLVDMYGLMVDPEKVKKLKEDFKHIKIIEDASEAHGASFNGEMAGSLGDISTFSFYANKIITTGEGGMVLTDDKDTYERLCSLRNLNFVDRKKYIHSDIGFNFRLSNLNCSLGLGQLKNIDKTIENRKRVGERYRIGLVKNAKIRLPQKENNVYWYYAIVVKEGLEKVIRALEENKIDYRRMFHPLHKQPFIKNNETLIIAEHLAERGLILPTYTTLEDYQIDFICDVINTSLYEYL